MKQTWRWFGPDDLVLLPHVKQAGATGIVTALHHMNRGQAWNEDEVQKCKGQIVAQGLTWDVVESIAVPENIKTRSGSFLELIDNYKASIRAIGRAGIKTACYNFMAITDWIRTNLVWPLPNGGSALRFDIVDFYAYDVLILKRRNAEAEHLDGDTDMVSVVAALLDEETCRKKEARADAEIPMRPDHGHLIVDDIGKKVNPGYSCIGRLKGLAELRGVMRAVAQFRAGQVRA
jgi:mannonate dehydratase